MSRVDGCVSFLGLGLKTFHAYSTLPPSCELKGGHAYVPGSTVQTQTRNEEEKGERSPPITDLSSIEQQLPPPGTLRVRKTKVFAPSSHIWDM